MSKELTLTSNEIDTNPMLVTLKDNASYYGIEAKIEPYKIDENKADSGYYIVAGLGELPQYNNPKEIEDDMYRNENLFYPKKFAVKLTPENLQFAIEEFYSYCQKAELLQCLYNEYDCKVPDVMRIEEFYNLYKFNQGWNNQDYDVFARRENKNALDTFFKAEKKAEKGGATFKWNQFYRSDLYDSRKGQQHWRLHMAFSDKDQIIPLSILSDCCRNITRLELTEQEFQQLKEILKKYPKIYYSADEKVVIDHGEIKGPNPWADEQSYFEYRDIIFKKVDEPIIMGEVYKMRYGELAKPREFLVGKDIIVKNVSYRYVDAFMSLAKDNGLYFAIDTKGEFKKATTDYIPVLFKQDQLYKFNSIMKEINNYHTNYHAFEESNLPFLSQNLDRAEKRATQQITSVALAPSKNKGLEL